ncbi:MAG: MBL fold metallo-hydrolase [Pseudomonadota bacterium]
MVESIQIGPGIFCVAGPELTDQRDAAAYLVVDGLEAALIDVGAGPSFPRVLDLIQASGIGLEALKLIIVTHAHIDHVGALAAFAAYSPEIAAHHLDAPALEKADPLATAASWYGLPLAPVAPTIVIRESPFVLKVGGADLVCLHTPGHTPGSLAVYLDREGKRYLFGQDIHGPFHPSFGSDLAAWRESMRLLLELQADVLAEGHLGVIYGRNETRAFIQGFLNQHAR